MDEMLLLLLSIVKNLAVPNSRLISEIKLSVELRDSINGARQNVIWVVRDCGTATQSALRQNNLAHWIYRERRYANKGIRSASSDIQETSIITAYLALTHLRFRVIINSLFSLSI